MFCDGYESALPDWLEGELTESEAAAMAAHAESCASCSALARDLRGISRAAAALPTLAPSRDLWAGIEARIQAPVYSLASSAHAAGSTGSAVRSNASRRWWVAAAAAAALVVTASSGYLAGVRSGNGGAAGVVATETSRPPAGTAAELPVAAAERDSIDAEVESGAAGQPSRAARRAPASGVDEMQQIPEPGEIRRRLELARSVRAPMDAEFDREIATLRTIMEERRTLLDSSTVAVIERTLRIIDQAIAESREALATDPASGFLNEQLNYALTRKVELLQTAVLLPPRT